MNIKSKYCNSNHKKKIFILLPDLEGGGAEKLHVNLANYWILKGFYLILMDFKQDFKRNFR